MNIDVAAGTTAPAFISTNGGTIAVDGRSSIRNISTTQLVIQTVGAHALDTMEFSRVISGLPNTDFAIDFSATTTGFFTIADEFTVGGVQGTEANNINNAGTVIISVP